MNIILFLEKHYQVHLYIITSMKSCVVNIHFMCLWTLCYWLKPQNLFISPKCDSLPKVLLQFIFNTNVFIITLKQFYNFNCIYYCSVYTGEFYFNLISKIQMTVMIIKKQKGEILDNLRVAGEISSFCLVDSLCLVKSACSTVHFWMPLIYEVEEFKDI